MTRMGRCVVVSMLTLVAVGGSAALHAQESGWSVRLNMTYTDPSRTHVDDDGIVRAETTTSEAFGLALSSEYRISHRLGVEVGVQAGYEADIRLNLKDATGADLRDPFASDPSDGLRFTIIDAALNIYLASGGVDFYIGPVIGYITYDDLQFLVGRPPGTLIDVETDGSTAFGGVLGLDIPCGNAGWFFTSSMKYLVSSYNLKARTEGRTGEADFDPFVLRAGFGYRF